MQSPARPCVLFIALAGLTAAGCGSSASEALVVLQVTAAPGVPSFDRVRFSVVDRPAVAPREAPYDPTGSRRFGYYLPGPNGPASIRVEALAAGCLVGAGMAVVDVRVGEVSAAVPLDVLGAPRDPSCPAGVDGAPVTGADAGGGPPDVLGQDGGSGGPVDAPASDGPDGPAADGRGPDAETPKPPPDARPLPPDTAPPPPDMAPPPACLKAVERCPGAAGCCAGLRCGNTTAGQVCCGDFNAGCSRPGGEDCCGQLECVSGRCCLPPVYNCTGHENECCGGRICGNTTAGHVCCGLAGAACSRPGGEDCCGQLECVNGHCR